MLIVTQHQKQMFKTSTCLNTICCPMLKLNDNIRHLSAKLWKINVNLVRSCTLDFSVYRKKLPLFPI